MPERQSHGFDYERLIIKKYNLKRSEDTRHDAYTIDNTPVQIKCIKFGQSIDMGDYYRNKTKKQDFILIIGFWKNKRDNIVEEHIIHVNHKKWDSLFRYSKAEEMKNELKEISNSYSDDKKWKAFMQKHKYYWNKQKRRVQLRFKRDHNSQKRIQCAINKTDFYNYFVKWEDEAKKTVFTLSQKLLAVA
jgi:hypothetical protein